MLSGGSIRGIPRTAAVSMVTAEFLSTRSTANSAAGWPPELRSRTAITAGRPWRNTAWAAPAYSQTSKAGTLGGWAKRQRLQAGVGFRVMGRHDVEHPLSPLKPGALIMLAVGIFPGRIVVVGEAEVVRCGIRRPGAR